MSIQFDPDSGVVRVEICVRGGARGDLNRPLVLGALHTLESIAEQNQGAVRRKLIAVLGSQVRTLKRNEDDVRNAKRGTAAC
ncbi:hypothetical protein [Stenotrophomonas rhizophila]|uniref:hypothetical protein n=1 Tax=Stenotrophomonas rhizophila TaxID=216778 RepID=UPI0028D093C2|nr:hypothetical protein [Stenotrophomonas rhizophila]